jgi:hypothetical protein
MMMRLQIPSTEMTPRVMQDLQTRGLINLLSPGGFAPVVGENESDATVIYSSEDRYGPHKLISCSINATDPTKYFGYHPEREEFLLIGDPDTKPIHLVVALCKKDVFEAMARQKALSADDFVALRMKYNDPQVSFFTMNPFFPHGEVTVAGPGKIGTFFVTEPRDIVIEPVVLNGYTWEVVE